MVMAERVDNHGASLDADRATPLIPEAFPPLGKPGISYTSLQFGLLTIADLLSINSCSSEAL